MATGAKMISMKKLPRGYRLYPSDEDLVNHHLKRKLLDMDEQHCLIPEFDIYKLPPWDLITKYNELSVLASDGGECFFFHRRINPKSKRYNRRTKEGYWKVTGEGRKPQESDRTKWLKRILVYYVGKQKSAVKTEWAMHEYENASDSSIVVCRIHKMKLKNKKEKLDLVSSEDSSNSPGAIAHSDAQFEPQETSPETSMSTNMESQNPNANSNANVSAFNTASPQQTKIVADERPSPAQDTDDTDFMQLADLEGPQSPHIVTREQSPCPKNRFINGYDQESSIWSHPLDFTLDEGGDMFMLHQIPTDQSLKYVTPGSVSPPQQPQMMPTEEISPHIANNTSFTGSGSGMIRPEFDIHGHGARLPVISTKYGAQDSNLEVTREYSELDSLVDSFWACPPPPDREINVSTPGKDSMVTGCSTEYHGVPYALGVTFKQSNPQMSTGY